MGYAEPRHCIPCGGRRGTAASTVSWRHYTPTRHSAQKKTRRKEGRSTNTMERASRSRRELDRQRCDRRVVVLELLAPHTQNFAYRITPIRIYEGRRTETWIYRRALDATTHAEIRPCEHQQHKGRSEYHAFLAWTPECATTSRTQAYGLTVMYLYLMPSNPRTRSDTPE